MNLHEYIENPDIFWELPKPKKQLQRSRGRGKNRGRGRYVLKRVDETNQAPSTETEEWINNMIKPKYQKVKKKEEEPVVAVHGGSFAGLTASHDWDTDTMN